MCASFFGVAAGMAICDFCVECVIVNAVSCVAPYDWVSGTILTVFSGLFSRPIDFVVCLLFLPFPIFSRGRHETLSLGQNPLFLLLTPLFPAFHVFV